MNEAETRPEHIDPALKAAGWGAVEGSRVRPQFVTFTFKGPLHYWLSGQFVYWYRYKPVPSRNAAYRLCAVRSEVFGLRGDA